MIKQRPSGKLSVFFKICTRLFLAFCVLIITFIGFKGFLYPRSSGLLHWPAWNMTDIDQYQTINTLQWRHNWHDSVSNHQPHDCLLNRLFRRRSKKTSKLLVTGLCAGNSPGTGEFSAQMASNAENVSIWWRHHYRTVIIVPVHDIKDAFDIQFPSYIHQCKINVAETQYLCLHISDFLIKYKPTDIILKLLDLTSYWHVYQTIVAQPNLNSIALRILHL